MKSYLELWRKRNYEITEEKWLITLYVCYLCCLNSRNADNTNTQTDSADDNSIDLSSDAPTDDSGTDITSDIQNGNIENLPEQSVELEENIYKSILLGKRNFICTSLGNKSLNISEINTLA